MPRFHYPGACIISIEKSAVNHIVASLKVKCLLSLTAFKIFFLVVVLYIFLNYFTLILIGLVFLVL